MKKWFTKVFNEIKIWAHSLAAATKNVETQTLSQVSVDSVEGGINVVQDVNQGVHELAKALLRGELTEEVKQLRYRNYKVDREAKKYKYFSPTLALKKKEGKDNKFISFDKSDGLEVITVQYNYAISEDVLDAINQIENGGRGKKTKYKFEFKRDFIPRFRMEEFAKKVVVKRLDETHAILDFYFSKYPERFFRRSDDKSFRSKVFIHEIESIRDKGVKSDMLDVEELRFVTNHAYKQDDLMEFVFKNIVFREVAEFDGDYILRFKASIDHDGIDLTAAFYNKEMAEKYENKEKKELVLDVSGGAPIETYVCSDCGKVVTFDTQKMEEMPISEARDIDAEINEEDSWSVTEYMDMQIIEQTIGKKLCKSCLKKYIDNRGLDLIP
nr:MAG TPA: nucleic-acid-binding protein [Ackermannviridae sp.]DAR64538.1 MAG TPA: nucleic-acid-binding protein [Caudoviricetes sp.]